MLEESTSNQVESIEQIVINSRKSVTLRRKLTQEAWHTYKEYAISSGSRRKLSCNFNIFLTSVIQDEGLRCSLRCSYNWLRQDVPRKKSAPLWRGNYFCKGCRKEFKCCIGNDFLLEINHSASSECHKESLANVKSTRGSERKQSALEIKAYGTSAIYNKNMIFNQNCSYPLKSSYLIS